MSERGDERENVISLQVGQLLSEEGGGRTSWTHLEAGAGEHRESVTAGGAVVASSVVAPCSRGTGEDLFVLSGGGERIVASRLVVPLPAISEDEEDRLSIEAPGEIDAETEARLLGEPPHGAVPVAAEVATEEKSRVAGQQARNGAPLQRRSSNRPEPLGREGTLEVFDPLPPMLPGIVGIEGGHSMPHPWIRMRSPSSRRDCSSDSEIRR